jgi:biopolymer transport protein TolR
MSSARRRTAKFKPIAEINVVPYVDVMLVLLVIFMIPAPMLTQGVTVDLPKATSENLKTTDREPVIVSVDQRGDYYLNVSSTPDLPMEPKALMLRVAAELELAKQQHETIRVLVKGDQGVPYGKVVEAMALLKQAGSEQVGLITDALPLTGEAQG